MKIKLNQKKQRSFRFFFLGLLLQVISFGLLTNTVYADNLLNSFQETTITGKVIDHTGNPLPGVNVVVKGTTVGAITNLEGVYSIEVPDENATLTFSYVGYLTEEVSLNGQTTVNITMVEDIQALDEVVVVGYGTVKKSDLTGAISGIDEEIITERGVTNPIQTLQGSMAGVQVSTSTGRLGDNYSVVIRGKNTLNADAVEPLYVVDGVITENIDFLNPQDIAQMDVLKDASSAAIYGSRGSNGVIIIQTKGGANVPSGTNVSFDTYYGIKEPARLPEMMSPEKWRYYHMSAYLATINPDVVITEQDYRDAVLSPSSNSLLAERFDNLDSFDWYDAVLKTGNQSNSHLSISHNREGSTYTFGLGYQNETGNIENESLNKYTLRASIDQKITDKLKTGGVLSFSLNDIERGSELAMQEAFRLNPFLSPWAVDENNNEIVGELYPQPGKLQDANGDYLINKTSTYNPLLEIQNSTDETRKWDGIGTAYLQYDVLSWLQLKSTFSGGLTNFKRGRAWGAQTNRGINNNNLPSSEVTYYESFNYSWDNQININKTVDKHNFNFLALQSIYVSRTDTSSFSSTNQPFNTEFYSVGSGLQSTFNIGTDFFKHQLASFALRLNYSFDDRYLLTITNRWDGSSLLADDLKWNAFPSAAVAWRISNESFLQDNATLSNLKLRLSYGFTGNNNVKPYSTVNTLNLQTFYDFYGTPANGHVSTLIANKNLTWESTGEINIGLDYGFMNNRIMGSVDWYNRLSEELLLNQNLPLETGFEQIRANAASVRNTGIEAMLSTINVNTSLITWETIFTFTKNTNTIESIYGQSEEDDIGNGWFIGESIDAHYNYKFDGIWQADEADLAASFNQSEGQAKVVDRITDGNITPEDRMILGSSDPSWTGGIISRLYVGNFDFNFSISTVQDVLAYSHFHANFENTRDRGRQKLDLADWYIPENDYGVEPQVSNSYPQPRNMGTYWRNDGVGYYKDASYVKINNISLGYRLPQSLIQRANISKLRLYVNILNPFVFTDYTGWDPEWAQAPFEIGRVASRTTQFGLSVNF